MKTWKRMWNDHRFVWAFAIILAFWSIPVMIVGMMR